MEEQILVSLAQKLGLEGDRIIKKAAENMRLADIRGMSSSLSSLNLSGSCKAVMCLELAATAFGEHVDKMTAIRVSGMKNKKIYNSALRAIECLLDLQSKVTVTDLVIQFGCPEAKQLTLQLLQWHGEQNTTQDNVEVSQIIFNAAALYSVCRHMKHRIEKGKLIDITGVTRALFDRVVAQMDKILSDVLKHQKNIEQKTNKRCASFIEQLEKTTDEQSPIKKTRQTDNEEDEECFEIWKEKILQAAYKALGKSYPS